MSIIYCLLSIVYYHSSLTLSISLPFREGQGVGYKKALPVFGAARIFVASYILLGLCTLYGEHLTVAYDVQLTIQHELGGRAAGYSVVNSGRHALDRTQ